MNELLEKNQIISIVPKDFRNSNKGKIIDIQERNFLLEVFHDSNGILLNNIIEFYSQTKNGMLYFTSNVTKIDDNILTVKNPMKHRFLQRRAFTRIPFVRDIDCKSGDKFYKIKSLDLSAGGIKLQTNESLNIDTDYSLNLQLLNLQDIKCDFQPIRIEKNDKIVYTLSGRFKNLSDIDKMTLVQFCMRKNIENVNK